MQNKEVEQMLLDTQKEYTRSNKMKDRIIIILIICMFLEAVIGYTGFIWYESQFVIYQDDESGTEITTEGENANIDYNNITGNQYNDNATHNEGE